MFLQPRSLIPQRPPAGFSLVEIMVGMVIGMLGLIIMMQVFTLSEGQKRSTTGGGDAQSSGAIALFGLQRDIRQAGYGITDPKLAGCNLTLRAGVVVNNLGPVTINHASITGQDANTDTLLTIMGNSDGSPQGDRINSQPLVATGAIYPDVYAMGTPNSFAPGDQVIATPQNRAAPCVLSLASVVAVGQVPTGNAANVVVTAGTGTPNTSLGSLFNVGRLPKVRAYAVRGGNLTVCDYMVSNCGSAADNADSTVWVPIASNIASVKAQYGRDTMFGLNPAVTTMDNIVDSYDQVQPANACDWLKISAVRMALVARNANYEKTDPVTGVDVTMAAPLWEGSTAYAAPNPPTANDHVSWTANPIVLTANAGLTAPATWRNYRYKVLQIVIPLRNLNLAWQGVPTGC